MVAISDAEFSSDIVKLIQKNAEVYGDLLNDLLVMEMACSTSPHVSNKARVVLSQIITLTFNIYATFSGRVSQHDTFLRQPLS